MVHDPDTVVRCRSRAEELRTFAHSIKDKKPREDIEKWANEYDQMALFAEQIKQSWRSLLYTGRSSRAGNRRRSR